MRLGERDRAGTGTGKGSPCRKSGAECAAFRLCADHCGCGWIKCCRTASAFVRVFYGKCDRYSASGRDGASDGRSIEDLKQDLVESAVRYGEEKGVTCVLKDAVTVTAGRDGKCISATAAAPRWQRAVPAIADRCDCRASALGFSEDEAAALGVFLHGRAGAAAACKRGEHSVLARDIADCLLEKID